MIYVFNCPLALWPFFKRTSFYIFIFILQKVFIFVLGSPSQFLGRIEKRCFQLLGQQKGFNRK